jgi:hypothetical protein
MAGSVEGQLGILLLEATLLELLSTPTGARIIASDLGAWRFVWLYVVVIELALVLVVIVGGVCGRTEITPTRQPTLVVLDRRVVAVRFVGSKQE